MLCSVMVFVILVWTASGRRASCRGAHCDKKPINCFYGPVKINKKWACGKGPGEICGGYQDLRGKCGSGMYCDNCGLCRGCSAQVLLDHHRLQCNNATCTDQPNYRIST